MFLLVYGICLVEGSFCLCLLCRRIEFLVNCIHFSCICCHEEIPAGGYLTDEDGMDYSFVGPAKKLIIQPETSRLFVLRITYCYEDKTNSSMSIAAAIRYEVSMQNL